MTVVIAGGTASIARDGPTRERIAKGDIRTVERLDANGRITRVVRSVTPSLVEQLSLAGELGENVPRLLAAAEWFMERADIAELRGRLVASQLDNRAQEHAIAADRLRARHALARCYDQLGIDAFNAIYDTLVWEIEPRGPDRRALFRAALHALDAWLRANENSPPA